MKCSEMKVGQIYICKECGLELKVVKECDCSAEGQVCSCSDESCCSEQLALKEE